MSDAFGDMHSSEDQNRTPGVTLKRKLNSSRAPSDSAIGKITEHFEEINGKEKCSSCQSAGVSPPRYFPNVTLSPGSICMPTGLSIPTKNSFKLTAHEPLNVFSELSEIESKCGVTSSSLNYDDRRICEPHFSKDSGNDKPQCNEKSPELFNFGVNGAEPSQYIIYDDSPDKNKANAKRKKFHSMFSHEIRGENKLPLQNSPSRLVFNDWTCFVSEIKQQQFPMSSKKRYRLKKGVSDNSSKELLNEPFGKDFGFSALGEKAAEKDTSTSESNVTITFSNKTSKDVHSGGGQLAHIDMNNFLRFPESKYCSPGNKRGSSPNLTKRNQSFLHVSNAATFSISDESPEKTQKQTDSSKLVNIPSNLNEKVKICSRKAMINESLEKILADSLHESQEEIFCSNELETNLSPNKKTDFLISEDSPVKTDIFIMRDNISQHQENEFNLSSFGFRLDKNLIDEDSSKTKAVEFKKADLIFNEDSQPSSQSPNRNEFLIFDESPAKDRMTLKFSEDLCTQLKKSNSLCRQEIDMEIRSSKEESASNLVKYQAKLKNISFDEGPEEDGLREEKNEYKISEDSPVKRQTIDEKSLCKQFQSSIHKEISSHTGSPKEVISSSLALLKAKWNRFSCDDGDTLYQAGSEFPISESPNKLRAVSLIENSHPQKLTLLSSNGMKLPGSSRQHVSSAKVPAKRNNISDDESSLDDFETAQKNEFPINDKSPAKNQASLCSTDQITQKQNLKTFIPPTMRLDVGSSKDILCYREKMKFEKSENKICYDENSHEDLEVFGKVRFSISEESPGKQCPVKSQDENISTKNSVSSPLMCRKVLENGISIPGASLKCLVSDEKKKFLPHTEVTEKNIIADLTVTDNSSNTGSQLINILDKTESPNEFAFNISSFCSPVKQDASADISLLPSSGLSEADNSSPEVKTFMLPKSRKKSYRKGTLASRASQVVTSFLSRNKILIYEFESNMAQNSMIRSDPLMVVQQWSEEEVFHVKCIKINQNVEINTNYRKPFSFARDIILIILNPPSRIVVGKLIRVIYPVRLFWYHNTKNVIIIANHVQVIESETPIAHELYRSALTSCLPPLFGQKYIILQDSKTSCVEDSIHQSPLLNHVTLELIILHFFESEHRSTLISVDGNGYYAFIEFSLECQRTLLKKCLPLPFINGLKVLLKMISLNSFIMLEGNDDLVSILQFSHSKKISSDLVYVFTPFDASWNPVDSLTVLKTVSDSNESSKKMFDHHSDSSKNVRLIMELGLYCSSGRWFGQCEKSGKRYEIINQGEKELLAGHVLLDGVQLSENCLIIDKYCFVASLE